MKAHKEFEENPENSPKNVFEVVEAKFESKHGEAMPKLLSDFISLLGNEEEKWGGVAAMRVCVNEFFSWKKKRPELNDKVSTFKDLENFLFSPDRNVIVIQGPDSPRTSKAVIQGVVVPPANPETLKGAARPSSSKTVNPDVVDLPNNPKTLKGTDNPSTSKAVLHGAIGQTFVPPAKPKTLKVKIYMGTGWDKDFPKLVRGSPSDLFVNLTIHGGRSKNIKDQKNSRRPCWGEEIVFPLSNLENAELIVEAYDHSLLKDKFAGKFCLRVSELKPGIQVIPLSYEMGKPCSSARLLVRFMFD